MYTNTSDMFERKDLHLTILTRKKSHYWRITSIIRDSLNGHSPLELSHLLLDTKLFTVMGYGTIDPDDVMLTPELLK